MKSRIATLAVLSAGLLLVASAALAHHGANLFDMSRAVPLKGTVTRFYWGNPHNQVEFDVKEAAS